MLRAFVVISLSILVATAQGLWTRTVAKDIFPVNLALSFARRGIRTGILDTDIFGPSIPTLLNLSGEPRLDESESSLLSLPPCQSSDVIIFILMNVDR